MFMDLANGSPELNKRWISYEGIPRFAYRSDRIEKSYLSNAMPMKGNIFCQQTILKFNNDCISFLCLDGGSWSLAINGDSQLLEAIRGFILVFHLRLVTSKYFITTIWLVVNVPVLSVQMQLAEPIVSFINFFIAKARLSVTANGNPSGTATTIMVFLPWTSIAATIIDFAVPEGLPLAVTLSLAFAMKKLMNEKALVRHLSACEPMGSASCICTDKIGTLTTNHMVVDKIWIGCCRGRKESERV